MGKSLRTSSTVRPLKASGPLEVEVLLFDITITLQPLPQRERRGRIVSEGGEERKYKPAYM
jgi:hypothetical protein